MIARHLSAIIIRKLWKRKKRFITRSGNYTTYLGPHSEVANRRDLTWGSAFIGIGIGGDLGFCGLTIFGNLNIRAGIYSMKREKMGMCTPLYLKWISN